MNALSTSIAERRAEPTARAERLWSLAAPTVTMLFAFAVFLKHHDYGLFHAEIAIAVAAIAGISAIVGAVAALGPLWVRLTVLWIVLAVFADIQFDSVRSPLAVVLLVGAIPALFVAGHHSARLVTVLFGLMLAVTLVLPARSQTTTWQAADAAPAGVSELPLLIHIVLDEQIGIEGIPVDFDQGGAAAELMAATYLDHDFQVYGRSFSQYYNTERSLAHVMSLGTVDDDIRPQEALRANPYFATLAELGYRIHVLQTDQLDFCGPYDGVGLASCRTSTVESANVVERADFGAGEKADALLGLFVRLSPWLERVRGNYGKLDRRFDGTLLDPPDWPTGVGRVSPLTARRDVDAVRAAIVDGRPGEAYIAHVLLPHYPYAYDRECALRRSPADWLTGIAPEAFPRRNTRESRALRYPLYLAQVSCLHLLIGDLLDALDAAGTLDDAIVIVHGDHGSRLDGGPPTEDVVDVLTDQDYVDAYSTLFAWHRPGGSASYETAARPIAALLQSSLAATLTGAPLDDDNGDVWVEPSGFDPARPEPWVAVEMPAFGR